MDAYLVFYGSVLHGVLTSREDVVDSLQEIFNARVAEYANFASTDWRRTRYPSDIAYASSQFFIKILSGDLSDFRKIPGNMAYSQELPDGVSDVTNSFYRLEQSTYAGNLKLFATVVKRGIKSTGLEVIVDPQVSGSSLRPISEYEDLVGSFSRVKATTQIHNSWSPVLFFAPESLGNYRVEHQQLSGNVVIFNFD